MPYNLAREGGFENMFADFRMLRGVCGGAASVLTLLVVGVFSCPLAAQRPSSPASKKQPAVAVRQGERADVAKFRTRVAEILSDARANRAYWGISVADRDSGRVLYALNDDHFFTPASNAKIFTTALALSVLGADYRFHTTIESNAALGSDGRLGGDLIFVGRGDPDLSNRKYPYEKGNLKDGPVDKVLAEMADAAVAKGLKEVDGDIVADDSYFPYDPYPAGWNAGDLFFGFGAPVSAIAFNDNTVTVEMRPGAMPGEIPETTVQPEAAVKELEFELSTVSSSEKASFAVVRQPGEHFILLRGAISPGHALMRTDVAMLDPAETAAGELKQLLEARGVVVTGGIRVRHGAPPWTSASGDPILAHPSYLRAAEGTPGASPLVLAEHVSQPLIEIVCMTNKVSQNLHAEILLRAVGREKFGVGSTAAGLKAERDFLKAAGVADGDVVLSDGSGLARDDLVTPRAALAVLSYALRQSWGESFLATLPVAGVDGTLENRMKNTPAAGLVEAKTGSADHARALSGYATTRDGEYLVFSLFDNNNPQHWSDATAALDAITEAMVEMLGTRRPVSK
ncbi:MAG: D-alanyl-D-alanine carboxypeptidase/D-alanyl-D-alanine-endopeptidase [Candidatus Acidiferrales bacterium]